ncbi:hypothetical protein [Bifidobacterium myosotis]|uniref:Uncharacterized protein n=1 Tax=Bifidobacterium myosotis TaxID=1630166 RepID=A0A5M9ZFM6_9BIFI|nr:hypothetical protein [Bifidobacterium myosotis]KAA8825087.1 hypothetical protein EMO91_12730 [Bifidobacterium myosotis]
MRGIGSDRIMDERARHRPEGAPAAGRPALEAGLRAAARAALDRDGGGREPFAARLARLGDDAVASCPWLEPAGDGFRLIPPNDGWTLTLWDGDAGTAVPATPGSDAAARLRSDPRRYRVADLALGLDGEWDALTRIALDRLLDRGVPITVPSGD